MAYSPKHVNPPETQEYRVFFEKGTDTLVSPFHDIPLWVDKEKRIVNMIVEIPRGTHAKLEISGTDPLNPIKQDVKKGKLRFVHDAYPFNYGAFPQTWENPENLDKHLNAKGDNDPIDAVEIGTKVHKTGDVIQVLILGVYAMVDEGEADWKIVCIDITDEQLKGKLDFQIPGATQDIVFKFLRDYKIPDGKPPNNFGFNNQLKDAKFASEVTQHCHEEWNELINNKTKSTISTICTQLEPSVGGQKVSQAQAKDIVAAQNKPAKL